MWRLQDDSKPVSRCGPVPFACTEDLFATLAGLQVFSKIDLSYACKQVELDEDSQKYLPHIRVCTVTNDCLLESPVHQLEEETTTQTHI